MAKLVFLSLAVVFLAGSIFAEDRRTPDVPTENPSSIRGWDVDPKNEPANRPSKSYDVEDPSDLDEQAMSADLELDEDDMDDEKKQPTAYDLDTEQDEKIRDIRRTLDKLEKKNSSSKTDGNDNNTDSNDNDSSDTDRNAEEEGETSDDANDNSMTPAERAFIRRITRTRRVYFPYRYFDANNEDQEGDNMMQGSDNRMDGSDNRMDGSDNWMSGSMEGNMPMDPSMMSNMNQQSMMGQGQQDGVVLRIPKRILKKLIRKFGRNGSRKMRRHHRRSSKQHGSGLRLVRLVPIILPMSSGMDDSV